MADYTLTAAPVLGGYHQSFGGLVLRELTDLGIVGAALPLGGEAEAKQAFADAFGTGLPEVGASVLSEDGAKRLVRLGRDQVFVLFSHDGPDAEKVIAASLGGTVYTVDQTDAWVALELTGATARTVLERICPLDLHPGVYATGQVARTVMEHLGVVVLCTGPETYVLMSASSSAGSFVHAIEVSIRNVE